MDSSSVPHLSFTTSYFGGTFDTLDVVEGVKSFKKLDSSRSLFERDDGVVRNNERDLRDSCNSVTTCKHEGSGC